LDESAMQNPTLDNLLQRFLAAGDEFPDLEHVAFQEISETWPRCKTRAGSRGEEPELAMGLQNWPDSLVPPWNAKRVRQHTVDTQWLKIGINLCQGAFYGPISDKSGKSLVDATENTIDSYAIPLSEEALSYFSRLVDRDNIEQPRTDSDADRWLELLYMILEVKPSEIDGLRVWRLPPGGFFRASARAIVSLRDCPETRVTGRKRGQSEGSRKRQPKGGKPRLEKSDPLKYKVYQRIKREHEAGVKPADIVDRLKTDTDFVVQVSEAELKLNSRLVKNALAYFVPRKKQQTPPS
jgi:hypothetical protein